MTSRGLILGKFMPPHAGHLRLAQFARRLCDELWIVVGSLESEPIDGAVRARWMEESCPFAKVVHLHEELPQRPEESETFWSEWSAALLGCTDGARPGLLFAGESYGARLARELGARFIPLDRGDGSLELSATELRERPESRWLEIAPAARRDLQRRIHVVGAESTGKSTLSRALAERIGGRFVPEYARTWLERPGAPLGEDGRPRVSAADMDWIARGHAASVESLASLADVPFLVLDTDAVTSSIWAEEFLGHVPRAVTSAIESERPWLTLLLKADLEWSADPVRYRPGEGQRFNERHAAALARLGRTFVEISGSESARVANAHAAVLEHMKRSQAT